MGIRIRVCVHACVREPFNHRVSPLITTSRRGPAERFHIIRVYYAGTLRVEPVGEMKNRLARVHEFECVRCLCTRHKKNVRFRDVERCNRDVKRTVASFIRQKYVS